MDNHQLAEKLKEIKLRKDYIIAHPEESNESIAKHFKVQPSTIAKDKISIAKRKEFE